jgi:hypothetical protein
MNRLDELVRATLEDRAEQAPSPIPVVNRVLTRRRQRARRGWLVTVAGAAATAAVVAVGIAVTDSGSDSGPSGAVVTEDDAAEIYSVVLERFLRESFRPEGGVPDTVNVLIRPQEDAGWTSGPPEVGEPIPPDARESISATLADLTTVTWVERFPPIDEGDTPETSDPVIRLGLLPSGDEINVSISASHGFDNAWLNTFVVSLGEDGHWRITGTDAPVGLT